IFEDIVKKVLVKSLPPPYLLTTNPLTINTGLVFSK
uniref:Uncharacterized protein n=1 Tax=Ciona intestinalis TaxID=7719 RepID=H2Y3Q5_CIOIN